LKVWHPRRTWHFADELPIARTPVLYPLVDVIRAWLPWALLTIFVFVWGLPAFKAGMAPTVLKFPVPGLHLQVAREAPVVPEREVEKAEYTLNLATAAGTSIFLAAIVSAFFLGIAPARFFRVF